MCTGNRGMSKSLTTMASSRYQALQNRHPDPRSLFEAAFTSTVSVFSSALSLRPAPAAFSFHSFLVKLAITFLSTLHPSPRPRHPQPRIIGCAMTHMDMSPGGRLRTQAFRGSVKPGVQIQGSSQVFTCADN